MAKKIIGFFLLFLGVIMILWGVWDSYQIFTAKKPAPDIFKISQVEQQTAVKQNSTANPQEMIQQQLQQTIQEQLKNILPAEFTNRILNLTAWSIFMAILVLAGGKISTIGASLLKEGKKEKADL
ncbi:MAG: hypothetical protein PHW31_04400 [Candidatus Pacebacteria bacterium]|nr:hypothetical protein [Candidatus Paceibacterota bacterium]